jgi:hypothetical protein
MSISKWILGLTITVAVTPCSSFGQQAKAPERDAQSIEILTRVIQASGGTQALAGVHDITESGEITFYWGENVKGPVTIRTLGGNHFQMEADLPAGKSTWVIRDGSGSKKDGDKSVPISTENAINLGNLTYPLGHIAAALADVATEVSFVGIVEQEGRSVYRLRVKGQLGLVGTPSPGVRVVKDILVDALSFDIVGVQDRPYRTYKPGRRASDPPAREIDFTDFRVVNGVRIPFSITTNLQGQKTLDIRLSEVTFNKGLGEGDFQIQK